MKRGRAANQFQLEALEPRMLLSGDACATGFAAPVDQLHSLQSVVAENQDALDSSGGSESLQEISQIFVSVAEPVGANEEGSARVEAASEDQPSGVLAASQAPATDIVEASQTSGVSASNPLTQQLTDTLHVANAPPVNGGDSNGGSEFVDPDILAGPKQAVIDGLTALGNWGNSLDTFAKLASNLPIIDRSIGSILDIGGLLLARLRDPIQTYLNSDATPTTDELNVAIENADFNGGGLNITLTLVGGGLINGNEFRFNVNLQATRTVSGIPISMGSATDDLDVLVRASASAQVAVTTTFNLNFGFGLKNLVESSPGSMQFDLSQSASDSFFIAVSSMAASAAVHVTGLNFNAKVGFIDVAVVNGSIDLDGNASIALTDPNSDGKITRTEFNNTPLATLVATSLSGSANASLPITNSLFPGTQTLTVNWADVNAPDTLTSNVASLTSYDRFENLTPQTFIDGFNSLANWLDSTNNVNMLGKPLPFISNALKTVLDIKNLITSRFITQTGAWDSLRLSSPNWRRWRTSAA